MGIKALINSDELIGYLTDKKDVAWALLDENGILISKGGDESRFGLQHADKGSRLADKFICFEGVFPLMGKPYEVYELELSTEIYVNIYCLPTNQGDLVILQDITEITALKKVIHSKTQEIIKELECV